MDSSKDIHELFLNADVMGLNDGLREGNSEEGKPHTFQTFYLRNKVCRGVIY